MMSKSKLSSLLKGKSVPNLPSYSSPWNKNDDKLWNAVKQQNLKQAKSALSKASVTPTKLGPQGKSVFHLACEIGNEQIVDAILASTQDVNDTTIQGVTALQRAAAKGHTNTVNKLLKKQACVDQRDCDGMTALHHACYGQHRDCVKALLIEDADTNAVEQGGKTPLFYSAHQGHVDICKWLLDRGADVNCQDKDNVTPLILAAKEGHKHVCELLLRNGANPELTDRYGKTALEYAVINKHLELQEVFARVSDISSGKSLSISDSGSHHNDTHLLPRTDVPENHSRSRPYKTENKDVHLTDADSIHSMDDSLLPNHHQSSSLLPRPSVPPRIELAYRELKAEHEQLNEDYTSLSIENLKLRDKFESLLKKLTDKRDVENEEAEETVPKSYFQQETLPKSLYSQQAEETVPKSLYLQQETGFQDQSENQQKVAAYKSQEQTLKKQIAADADNPIIHNTRVKEIIDSRPESDITGLQKQMLALRNENEELKLAVKTSSSSLESSFDVHSHLQVKTFLLEREHLEKQISQLKEELEKQQIKKGGDHEELVYQNKLLTIETESLRQTLASLQEELDVSKNKEPTDAQRLDAILAASRNFEEVNFDEEGFVEGRDITKEEFLQGQNQQLKTQCGCLTEELEKLRATFAAILKAGDNLQADYDHLATEKDALQDELESTVKEKSDVIAENEFLLTDNNELHENLKKIVHELEKMQEKYQISQSENEELKRSVTVASKVGEVARLLEERTGLQQRCADLESTSQRLQHDHDILLEEVQSLNESLNKVTGQRNQLAADLEEMESICHQHEALQVEYNQLEIEFAELLRDKEVLEEQISNNNEVKEDNDVFNMPDITSLETALKQLRVEKQQVEAEKQELEDVVNGLTRHIVTTENKLKILEENLEQSKAASVKQKVDQNEVADDENNKNDEFKKQKEEIISLKKHITQLSQEVEEWEKRHADTVTTYRTHLLSAVQGHMDPDVKDALYHIIELRSMEQFC